MEISAERIGEWWHKKLTSRKEKEREAHKSGALCPPSSAPWLQLCGCSIVCEGVGVATGPMGRRHTNKEKMQLSNYGEVIGNYDLTFQIN
jgi:hypothetical protein